MGEALYTYISHGRGGIADAGLFTHILRDQLKIDADKFWAAVDGGIAPQRPRPGPARTEPGIDAKLARNLLRRVGLSPAEISTMTQEQALRRWHEWLTDGMRH
jgi:hypothetical protein